MASPPTLDIPFVGGAETKLPPGLVPPGQLLVSQNTAMRKRGEVGKRWGFAPIQHPAQSSVGWTDATAGELLVGGPVGGTWEQHSWSPSLGAWIQKGSQQPVTVKSGAAVGGSSDKTNVDMAIATSVNGVGFACYAWIEPALGGAPGRCMFSVIDEQTGTEVMAPQAVSGAGSSFSAVRVVAIWPFFLLVCMIPGTGLVVVRVDPGQGSVLVASPMTETSGVSSFDGRAVSGASFGHAGQYVALVWTTFSGLFALGFDPWAFSVCIAARSVSLGGPRTCCATFNGYLGILSDAGEFSGTLVAFWLTPDLTTSSFQTVDTPVAGAFFGKCSLLVDSGAWTAVYEEGPTFGVGGEPLTLTAIKSATGVIGSGAGTASYAKRNASLAGDAFYQGLAAYFLAVYQGTSLAAQPTFFLERLGTSGATETARAQWFSAGGVVPILGAAKSAPLSQAAAVPSGGTAYGCSILTQASAIFDGAYVPSRTASRETFIFSGRQMSAQIGGDLFLTGGLLSVYDGHEFVEQGFNVSPEPLTAWYGGIGVVRTAIGNGSGSIAFVTITDTSGYSVTFTRNVANAPFSVVFTGTGGYSSTWASNVLTIAFADDSGDVPTIGWLLTSMGSDPNVTGNFLVASGNGSGPDLGLLPGTFTSSFSTSTGASESVEFYVPPDAYSPDLTKYGSGWQIRPSSYLILTQALGTSAPFGYIWFQVDGIGLDPAPLGALPGYVVFVASSDSARAVANSLAAALVMFFVNNYPQNKRGYVTMPSQGSAPGGGPQTWKVSVQYASGGGSIAVSSAFPCSSSEQLRCDVITGPSGPIGGAISCPLGIFVSPGGYILVQSDPTQFYALYFVVGGAGTAPTGPFPIPTLASGVLPVVTPVAVTIESWYTGDGVASAVALAMNAIAGNPFGSSATNAYPAAATVSPVVTYALQATPFVGAMGPYNVNASGGLPDGTYQFAGVWERVDARGLFEQSAPGVAATVTIQGSGQTFDPFGAAYAGSNYGGPQSAILIPSPTGSGMLLYGQAVGGSAPFLSCPSLWLTQKSSQLAIYRTTVNPGQDPAFYRVTSAGAPPLNQTNPAGPSTNAVNPLTGTSLPQDILYFLDSSTDHEISANAALYTGGGAFANDPAPGCSFLCVHRGRVWVVPTENPNTIWYSDTFVDAEKFSVDFDADENVNLDPQIGVVTGLTSMDDKLVVFGTLGILVITGDGPSLNGQGDFDPPFRPLSTVGCSNPGSIVADSSGIWFQAAGNGGLYFINRNLEVSYRGQSVESWTSGTTIVAALLVPAEAKLVWFCASVPGAASQATDYAIEYNYETNWWSQSMKWAGNAACLWTPPGGAAPVIVFCDGAGNVEQQTPGHYTDAGAAIVRQMQTAWWGKQIGEQGFIRIDMGAVYGQWGSLPSPVASKIKLLLGYDFETPTMPVVWDPASLLAAGSGALGQPQLGDGMAAQFRFFVPPGPRGGDIERLSIVISDIVNPAQADDPGFQFDMVSVEVQPLGGLSRLGPLRTTG